jgi:hypothetical protein
MRSAAEEVELSEISKVVELMPAFLREACNLKGTTALLFARKGFIAEFACLMLVASNKHWWRQVVEMPTPA